MFNFFFKRLLRNYYFYVALLIVNLISILYVILDIIPNANYNGNPYTRWIGSYTASELPTIFFFLMPLVSSLAFSNIYSKDKKTGLISYFFSKGLKKDYFITLFIFNFIAGGFIVASALMVNIYGCFMFLPNQPVDMFVNGNMNVPLLYSNTLFPSLYYSHPFIHMMFYVLLAFVVAGIFSSIALTSSLYLPKKDFLIFLSPFVLNYVWILFVPNSKYQSSFIFTTFSKQVSNQIIAPIYVFTSIFTVLFLTFFLYLIGIKKNEKN